MRIEMDMCAVIGVPCRAYCNNSIVLRGMENGKFVVLFFTPVSVPGNWYAIVPSWQRRWKESRAAAWRPEAQGWFKQTWRGWNCARVLNLYLRCSICNFRPIKVKLQDLMSGFLIKILYVFAIFGMTYPFHLPSSYHSGNILCRL
jgi:hypothetical protein